MTSQYKDANGVYYNRLGITDAKALQESETALSALRMGELIDHPIPGTFDLEHLKRIHGHIFQDVYSWAGEIRVCDLSKYETNFCSPEFIESYLNGEFKKLRDNRYYIDGTYKEKLVELAALFNNINQAHPFREGNGRTQKQFMEWLGIVSGVSIEFAKVKRDQLIEASIAGRNSDDLMIALFEQCGHSISENVQMEKSRKLIPEGLYKELFIRR